MIQRSELRAVFPKSTGTSILKLFLEALSSRKRLKALEACYYFGEIAFNSTDG